MQNGDFIMDALKKFFPLSFKYIKDVSNLVIGILIQFVAIIIVGALIGLATFLTAWIPVVGAIIAWALGLISSLLGLYFVAGIVIQILVYCKVIKD